MDVFSHALWSGAVMYPKYKQNRRQRYLAVFFGVLPDIIPFAPAFIYMFVSNVGFDPGAFDTGAGVFQFAREAYNFTHSLVIFAVISVIVMVIRHGQIYWPMLTWGLHILMDIPTHPDFFQTPFLFPLSNYRFPWGISWANPWMLAIDWLAILVTFVFIVRDIRKTRGFRRLAFLNSK